MHFHNNIVYTEYNNCRLAMDVNDDRETFPCPVADVVIITYLLADVVLINMYITKEDDGSRNGRYLSYALGQTSLLSNTFQILSIWITVHAEVCVEDSQLFLCERRSDTFCLQLVAGTVFAVCCEMQIARRTTTVYSILSLDRSA